MTKKYKPKHPNRRPTPRKETTLAELKELLPKEIDKIKNEQSRR
jgi:hypothetical protein